MANKVQISILADAKNAVRGFDDTGTAAVKAKIKVEDVGDATDTLATKSGTLTGALGAVGGGLGLIGMEQYADSLGVAAMASDLVSGASDLITLALQSTLVTRAKDMVSMAAHKTASVASAAASGVMTAAQWALNTAMSANPVGLIVIGLVALVAGLVIAYKKSETFRNIVQAVGRAGKAAIGWVIGAVSDLIGWVRGLPGAFNRAKDLATTALGLITLPLRTVIKVVGEVIGWVRDKLPAAFNFLLTKASEIGSALLKPFRDLMDLIKDIISKIKSIKLPDLPSLPGFGRTSVDGGETADASAGTVINVSVTIAADATTDRMALAREITAVLDEYAAAGGRRAA